MNADAGQVCLITVDGTDFRIQEPQPFSPQWYSHKFNGPGVRYEVGICIKTGWIVWVHGPFPCGTWPDLAIARNALIHELDPGEFYVADGGYRESFGWSDTPTGLHRLCDRTKALARARHETVNGRFKVFGALKQIYRHDLSLHSLVFRSIANITQVSLRTKSPLFSIDYNEREMLAFDTSLLA